MRVLMVGAAGHVGGIVRPALMAAHDCRFFDRVPVPDAETLTTVADVNDETAIARALQGAEVVVFMPLGKTADGDVNDVDAAFDVNVKATYRWFKRAMDAGIQRFVYVSSLSVHGRLRRGKPVTEQTPAEAWDVYGLTKALAEQVCRNAAPHYAERTIVVLRLMMPTDEAKWQKKQAAGSEVRPWHRFWLGPRDTANLFLAAVNCDKPGLHILQATGDLTGERFPWQTAHDILGWRPRGE